LDALIAGDKASAGENENLVIIIPLDYKVVYSIEHQPAGPARHISISVSGEGNWPNIIAINEILGLFDFNARLNQKNNPNVSSFWQDFNTQSVNVLELISD